jgi:hypothetical protein
MAGAAHRRALPGCVVFDLDNCVWTPELYELWGGGGAPFTALPCGAVRDRAGTRVELLGAMAAVLAELRSSPLWAGVPVCVASCCDEPAWAHECLSKMLGAWSGLRGAVELRSCRAAELQSCGAAEQRVGERTGARAAPPRHHVARSLACRPCPRQILEAADVST